MFSSTTVVVDVDEFRSLRGHARDIAFMDVEIEIRRLTALRADLVHEVKTSLSFLDDQHHTAGFWFQAVTNGRRGSGTQAVRTGATLADMPVLAAAARAGEIGEDQLALLSRIHANPRVRDLLPASDELLTGLARMLAYREFDLACQRCSLTPTRTAHPRTMIARVRSGMSPQGLSATSSN